MNLGLRQEDLAERLAVRVETLRRWEWEADQPSIEYLPSLIGFLGYDPGAPLVTLGDHLRARRRALGITQHALAVRLGVSHDSVGGWEADQHRPTDVRTREALASELGSDVALQLGLVDSLDLVLQETGLTLSDQIRRALSVSQSSVRQASTRVGVHEDTLRRWKTGARTPVGVAGRTALAAFLREVVGIEATTSVPR